MTITVVHVTASDRYAGVESHVRALACAQADSGLEVTVFGGDPTRMGPELAAHGVRFAPARTLWDVVRRLRTVQPDIVHSHLTAADTAAYLGTRVSRTPVVTTRHTPQYRGGTWLRRGALRHTVSRATAAEIAVSSYAADFVDGTCTVIHAGVPTQELVPAGDRGHMLLIAQRLEPEKATSEAVDIAARSGLLRRGWRLQIAGDGALRRSLAAQLASLGINGETELLGHAPSVRDHMRAAGILLAPCPTEAFGLSVVEAMASGLPVVASGSGGHLETVGAVAPQLLYCPGDVTSGADMLARLAGDPSARDRVGRALHTAQRQRFTLQRQVELTMRVYRSVL